MKKYTLLVALLLASVLLCNGQQYKNTIKLGSGGFIVPGLYNPKVNVVSRLLEQHGFYYERKLSKRIQLSCGLSWWNSYIGNGYYFGEIPQVISHKKNTKNGVLTYRENNKMLDAGLLYKVIASKRQELKAGAGLTLSYGRSIYSSPSIGWIMNYDPQTGLASCGGTYFSEQERNEGYVGLTPAVVYDYFLLKGRIAVGADFKCRKYLGLSSSQMDYGVHVGVSF